MKKLLKYDIKAVFKLWWIPLLVVSILFALGCVGAALTRQGIDGLGYFLFGGSETAIHMSTLGTGIFLLFVGAASIWVFGYMGLVMPLICYAQSFFTDQAYLTFTLPVKNKTLYHSKLATAMIFYALTTVIQFLFTFILGAIFIQGYRLEDIFGPFDAETIGYLATKLTLMLVQGAVSVLAWQFAFNIGGFLAKSNKVLFIILAVFATLSARKVLESLFTPAMFLVDYSSELSYFRAEIFSGLTFICFELVLGWVFYLASRHLIEKKVNLL